MHFRYSWLVFFLFGLVGIDGSLPYIFLSVTVEPKGTMAAQQISRISTDLGNTVWIFDAVALAIGVATLLVSPQFEAILKR